MRSCARAPARIGVRFLVGEQRELPVPGAPGVGDGLRELASGHRMVSKLGQVWSRLSSVERLERLDRQPVQAHAAGARKPVVERVADEDVREAKSAGAGGEVGEDAVGDRLVGQVEQLTSSETPLM